MASVGGNNSNTLSLNLNPMLDIFSILITFLLMSFSSDPVSYDVSQNLELPDSKTLASLDEVPSVSVSKTEIRVNEKVITQIVGGDVPEAVRSQGAIMPLYEELVKLNEANKRVVKTRDGETKKAGTLTLELDRDHNFKLMKRIMLSGQQAEFITFKLMVAKEMN